MSFYPKKTILMKLPSIIEEKYGHVIKTFQVSDSHNGGIGFAAIIGQATPTNTRVKVHIPEGYLFAVILIYCEYTKRALIYTVDREGGLFFYRENHEFAPDTIWGDNIMNIIKNLIKEAKGLDTRVELDK